MGLCHVDTSFSNHRVYTKPGQLQVFGRDQDYFWPEGMYSPQAHLALAQTYCIDERFKQYYEAIAPGGAEFLYEALKAYLPK